MAHITVKSLAAAVGVSPASVSNAYNRPDQLSAALRERILAKAEELGYAGPDAAGRMLRVGRADAVGVLLSDRLSYAFSDPYAIEFLAGLSEVVEQRAISIVLMPLSYPPGAAEPDVTAVRQASIDAMTILSSTPGHPAVALARARGIRLVGTDPDPDPDSTWVAIDDHGAGLLVGQHLAELGHHDVAVLAETTRPAGSPGRWLDPAEITYLDYAARLAGLQESIPGDVSVVSGGHNAEASGVSATEWLLDQGRLPTAIVALSDVLALGVLTALGGRGLGVPTDVSVCGFDDIPAAHVAGLTTVRQPIREKGRNVGRLLVDADATPRQVLLPIELVPRRSSGPARVR